MVRFDYYKYLIIHNIQYTLASMTEYSNVL